MQAVILAAGLGTRMKELTKDTPKPLLPIGSKTLLEYKLENLPAEIDEVVIVVGYLGDKIKAALGESFAGKKIAYVEQKELLGTWHALSLCKPYLRGKFLVLMGDDLYKKRDLENLIAQPLALLAWALPYDEGEKKMAAIKMDSEGELVEILEKQAAARGMLVNTGAYVLDARLLDYPPVPAETGSKEMGLPQTIVTMAKAGEKFRIVPATWWKNVTSPEDLKAIEG